MPNRSCFSLKMISRTRYFVYRRFTPRLYTTSKPKLDPKFDDDDALYSKETDPMKDLSPQEQEEVKKRIRNEGRAIYNLGMSVIGGGIGVFLLAYLVLGPPKNLDKRASQPRGTLWQ